MKKNNFMKMKKNNFWIVCWIINILYALAILMIPIFYVYYADDFESKKLLGEYIREYSVNLLFRLAGLVTFVFWIYNIIVWNKRKESILHLLLLIFLNVLYAPIYYIRVIKK